MDGADRVDERIANNQAIFRRVNEAREPSAAGDAWTTRYVCECGRLGCTATVSLTRAEYEAVRSGFDRFLLIPGHEMEPDRVIEDHGRYVVADKVGWAAEVARRTDQRDGERA